MKTLICNSYLLVCLILISCTPSERQHQNFTLNGRIVGQDTGKIILRMIPDSTVVYDTAEIVKGKFIFKGIISEPTIVRLYTDNDLNQAEMYIESGMMSIIFEKDDFRNFKLSGSKTQEEHEVLERELDPINNRIQILNEEYSRNYDSIENSIGESKRKEFERRNEIIDNKFKAIRNEVNKVTKDFIKSNPKSYVSIYNLWMLGARDEMTIDSLKLELPKLDKTLQESKYGKMLLNDIRKKENIQIGSVAPDFSVIDINDQRITLSQFKSKNAVILDFWASWCIPCRESLSHLKKTYDRYHSKGLEVIAVSYLEYSRESWKKAVLEDSLHIWINTATIFRNEEPMSLNITNNYYIVGIPFILLIDKEGIIAGNWGGYSKEIAESIDIKIDEVLKK